MLAGWIALTLTLTSIPNPSFQVRVPHQDKTAHLCFYGVLGTLFKRWRRESGDSALRAVLGAILFAAAFGAFDEVHQRFIPGRSMELLDWAADVSGGALGAVAASVIPHLQGAAVESDP
jgi:VanZ family protein